MKQLIGKDVGSYTFNPAAQSITVSGVTLDQEQILLITNTTTGDIIYSFADPAKGGFFAAGVITLGFDTTGMNAADRLQIYVDVPAPEAATATKQDSIITKLAELISMDNLSFRMRTALSALSKFTFSTTGARVDCGGSSVTVSIAASQTLSTVSNLGSAGNVCLGCTTSNGQSIQLSSLHLQQSFRRNLTVS